VTPPKPRRPASSRGGTPRPRRLAGQSTTPQTDEVDEADEAGEAGEAGEARTEPVPAVATETPAPAAPAPPDEPEEPGPSRPAGLGRPGATRLLTIAVAVVAVILVLEAAWFVVHMVRDDPVADTPAAGTIAVPSDRPVLASSVAVQEAVDEAATAAQKIVGRGYKTYDKDVDAAVALMTPDYAEEFKATTDDVRAEFIRRKTEVQARVVGQGVVRANDTEVQALVFLNEYVTRGSGKGAKTVYTQYRALLTMVHTDKGWLVDGLDTK
jgi:Mce-associated membrane protein